MDDLTTTALAHHVAAAMRKADGEPTGHSIELYEAWAKGVIATMLELDAQHDTTDSPELADALAGLAELLTDAEVAATPDPDDWPVASDQVEQELAEQEARGA